MSVYAVCLYDTIVSAGKCNCVLATCYHIFCEHHYIIRLITSSLYINFLIDLGIQSITTLSLLNISPSSTSVCVSAYLEKCPINFQYVLTASQVGQKKLFRALRLQRNGKLH